MNRRFGASAVAIITAVGSLTAVSLAPIRASATTPAAVNFALYHDGWSTYYRSPFGAAPTSSVDHFRFRTSTAVQKATFYLVNEVTGAGRAFPMTVQSHNSSQDFWYVEVPMPSAAAQMGYHFSARSGKTVRWYGDNSSVGENGPGESSANVSDVLDYGLTVYLKSFQTPAWMKNAVIYQIFPDRFYNGNTSNDPKTGQKFGYITIHFHKSWSELPDASACGCDYFGGDLQGIIDKLGYLHSLGVNVLYLNPIFLAPSNHKYDTSNFLEIDPEFGTLRMFHTLVHDARLLGIRIILDGAFEETGTDSVYFDRYHTFRSRYGPGAYESKTSHYFPWYTFFKWPNVYESFEGVKNLPQLNDSPAVRKFVFEGPNSVVQYWLKQGAAGWRLDNANSVSDSYWQAFRAATKAAYPKSVIIGEDFSGDPTPQLSGGEWDGSMNYRFREAVLDFFANGFGAQNPTPYTASAFLETEMGLLSEVPRPAVIASMDLVGSHDTERVLSALSGNKNALRLVALYQMTWLGAPTVYYGDETGLEGLSDPDDRRTFPWSHQDRPLEAYYRGIIHMRLRYPALTQGGVAPLLASDKQRSVAYLRRLGKQNIVVALNDSGKTQKLEFAVPRIANGSTLISILPGSKLSTTVRHGSIELTLPALSGGVMLLK
jgi:cyclomaltodextrinase / maltogenic alpha-amylase / neopullulanase